MDGVSVGRHGVKDMECDPQVLSSGGLTYNVMTTVKTMHGVFENCSGKRFLVFSYHIGQLH